MILYANCTECEEEILFRTGSLNRADLRETYGESLQLTCTRCLKADHYPLADLQARTSKRAFLLSALVLLIGTPAGLVYFWDYIGQSLVYASAALVCIISIPAGVYRILHSSEEKKVRAFNRSQ
ncbi:MAG: hypothetical protein JW801_03540 [Bacteroidales bacterium]|nr:hypothetical protein [Bacteroidales bacterium]